MSNEPNIDWKSIGEWEGTKLDMYVPIDKDGMVIGKSGPTIGTGVDLGAWKEDDLRKIGVSDALLEKLRPYFQRRGEAALTYVKEYPLKITETERLDLDSAVQKHFVKELTEKYDNRLEQIEFAWPVPKAKRFTDLPREIQTVIYSVTHQYGLNVDERAPRFWTYATQQRWGKLIDELKNFGDTSISRRGKEAASIEKLFSKHDGTMEIPSRSYVPAGVYTGQIADGIPCGIGHWVYTDKPRDADTYTGECAQGMPWGDGKIKYLNGETFDGFVVGSGTAEGTYTYLDGKKFIGWHPDGYRGGATILFPDGRIYERQTRSGYGIGYGRMTYPDGRVETGRWANAETGIRYPDPGPREESFDTYEGPVIVVHSFGGLAQGYIKFTPEGEPVFASMTWPGNQTYEGGWSRSNEASGRGRFRDPKTGLSYTGNFVNGRFQGKGLMTTPKDRYEGEFEKGMPEGEGTYAGENGTKASGQWSWGMLKGKGVLQTTEGRYEGTFTRGAFDGMGAWVSHDGKNKFVGHFQAGAFNDGTGTWTSPNGETTYSGEWEQGRPHGQGELTAPQEHFSGTWADGSFRNGNGSMTTADGTQVEGTWHGGQLRSGTITRSDGMQYTGDFADGSANGNGSMTTADGTRLEGTWRGGQLRSGTITWPDKKRYEGPVGDDGALTEGKFFDAQGRELGRREPEHHGPERRELNGPRHREKGPDTTRIERPQPEKEFCVREKEGPWVCRDGGMEF